jgi:HAD superfamily hydrolase (TIGR01509 family)
MPDLSKAKAVIFDLDGTLYRQDALRRAMLLRLARAHALHPITGLRTARVIAAYRRAQEHLREPQAWAAQLVDDEDSPSLAHAQLRLTCQWTGADPAFVTRCVARWMDQDPLTILAQYRRPGLLEFVQACRQRGLRLGVLSDYPAEAKLAALGLDGMFDVVLAAQSAEVGAFKPNPRGLLAVAARLRVQPDRCVYIGDRVEVDAAAARAAGMSCLIVACKVEEVSEHWAGVAGFEDLQPALNASDSAQPLLDQR